MAKQRPTWAKRMKELRQMEKKQAKAEKKAARRADEDEGTDVQDLKAPLDPEARAAMFDGLF